MSDASPPSADRPRGEAVRFHAVVPAAGRGERFGGEVPKQFLPVEGRPLLAWTIERLLAAGCASVAVAVPASELAGVGGWIAGADVRWVEGGATRQESVAAALAASPAGAEEMVAVHDGARAAIDAEDLRSAVAAALASDGAVLGRMASDTMKEIADGRIVRTVERSALFHAETPQVFRRELLERALDRAAADGFTGTDEASIVERLGGATIAAVVARRPNPKVTFAEDLPRLASLLLDRGPA